MSTSKSPLLAGWELASLARCMGFSQPCYHRYAKVDGGSGYVLERFADALFNEQTEDSILAPYLTCLGGWIYEKYNTRIIVDREDWTSNECQFIVYKYNSNLRRSEPVYWSQMKRYDKMSSVSYFRCLEDGLIYALQQIIKQQNNKNIYEN